MVVSIGGVIYEARGAKANIYDVYSSYITILEKSIDEKISRALNKVSIPSIQFKSIGLEMVEATKRIYSIREIRDNVIPVPKKAAEAIGSYNITYEKLIKISQAKSKILQEAYDERDSSNGYAFEIIGQISRYCNNFVNASISALPIDYAIEIEDLGVRCEYSDGHITVDIIDEDIASGVGLSSASGQYDMQLSIDMHVRCSLLPA
jgi:hypothetical protein